MFTVKGDKSFKMILKVSKEWPKRTSALRKRLAYEAAMKTRAGLLEKIPSGPQWKAYRESLIVSEVTTGGDTHAYAVRSNPASRAVSEVDAPFTVLYVRVKPRTKKPKESIQILEKYNPWTLDTLPFTPESTDALIIQRKSTERMVGQVKMARRKDRHKWRAELSGVGVRVQTVRPAQKKTPRVVSDVAHEAFRLEFGLGVKPEPHWRPTLNDLKTVGVRRIARNPKIRMLFTNPSFTGWKRWEKIQTASKIRPGETRKFVPFQRKLGIRV